MAKTHSDPMLSVQVVYQTTPAQDEALRALAAEFGIKSRAEVIRQCVDAGLATVRKRYARSTLTGRKAKI